MEQDLNKRKEVVGVCLDAFISKGLAETTSRDLSAALQLQSGGLYYYFSTKDEAVLACAVEAAGRLERELMLPAFENLHDPDKAFALLQENADRLAPTMRFFTQVCTTPKYAEKVIPILGKLEARCAGCIWNLAQQLDCDLREIQTLAYLCVTAITNYMIFGSDAYMEQLDPAKIRLAELMNAGTDYSRSSGNGGGASSFKEATKPYWNNHK